MTIARILASKGSAVYSITPTMTIHEAARTLRHHHVGAVLVLAGDGAVEGVLSERDIVRAIVDTGPDALSHPVQTIMTTLLHTVRSSDTIQFAMEQMTTRRIRHLPVIDHGKLTGMVSIGDLVKIRIEDSEREAAALKEYISAA